MREGRDADALRPVTIRRGYTDMTPGSVLMEMGRTKVLCTVAFDDDIPPWMRESGEGWVTAEYAMLPGSSPQRVRRSSISGGRTKEIQRLIGRSLRAVVDPAAMGPLTARVDCDVLQADGGTRTAAITGAWVALADAFDAAAAQADVDAMAAEAAATAAADAAAAASTAQATFDAAGMVVVTAQMVLDDAQAAVDVAQMVVDEAQAVVQAIVDEIEGTEEFVANLDEDLVFALNRARHPAVQTDLLPLDIDLDLLSRITAEDLGNGEIQALTRGFRFQERFNRKAADFATQGKTQQAEFVSAKADEMLAKNLARVD